MTPEVPTTSELQYELIGAIALFDGVTQLLVGKGIISKADIGVMLDMLETSLQNNLSAAGPDIDVTIAHHVFHPLNQMRLNYGLLTKADLQS